MKRKSLIILMVSIAVLLIIPLIVMQFTDEVNWSLFDFITMAMMLIVAGTAGHIILTKVSNKKFRIAMIITIIVVFLLLWAELGVGIIGTPFAGS